MPSPVDDSPVRARGTGDDTLRAEPDLSLRLVPGFWMTCTATSNHEPDLSHVRHSRSETPSAMARALRVQLRTLVSAAADETTTRAVHEWIDGGFLQCVADLHGQQPYSVEFDLAEAFWRWSIRPVTFLPLVARPGDPHDTP